MHLILFTQVERHFSRLAFLRNKWRNKLSTLALDGTFMCQQYWQLVSLAGMCAMRRRRHQDPDDWGSCGEADDLGSDDDGSYTDGEEAFTVTDTEDDTRVLHTDS
eukprot:GHVU01194090.1.p2 GENE.GHVU01194090.1~~GHVU01194090.1.p2  ORF type:complete len:105 (+),score=16.73 GHVU01194090.1:212-526(+)